MRTTRRRTLFGAGAALAAVASAGCLQGDDTDSEDDRGGTATDDGGEPTTAVPEEPRVDEPPYEVEEQPDDAEAWNELYLCENMPAETDLEFQQVSAPRADLLLSGHDHEEGDAYAVRALTSAEEVREVFELDGSGEDGGEGGESEEPIDRIDFEQYVLLVVEDGYGSGSVTHHWRRVEATDRGFRLHGCQVKPYVRTSDVASRHSVVKVERPEGFEFPRVSLTVDEERRVHFNSTEGVVSVGADR